MSPPLRQRLPQRQLPPHPAPTRTQMLPAATAWPPSWRAFVPHLARHAPRDLSQWGAGGAPSPWLLVPATPTRAKAAHTVCMEGIAPAHLWPTTLLQQTLLPDLLQQALASFSNATAREVGGGTGHRGSMLLASVRQFLASCVLVCVCATHTCRGLAHAHAEIQSHI